MREIFLMPTVLLTVTGLQAQSLTVTGKETDQSGVPVIGAVVTVQDTGTGTATNASERYKETKLISQDKTSMLE